MTPCYRYFVSGKVQGVAFRASTRQKALQLGLSGHARNMEDGRVEVIACGSVDKLERLRTWLHDGPPLAVVTEVRTEEIFPITADGFRTL